MISLTNKQTVAYLRVSTQDQDLEKNKMDILLFANEKNLGQVKFIEDKASAWFKSSIHMKATFDSI